MNKMPIKKLPPNLCVICAKTAKEPRKVGSTKLAFNVSELLLKYGGIQVERGCVCRVCVNQLFSLHKKNLLFWNLCQKSNISRMSTETPVSEPDDILDMPKIPQCVKIPKPLSNVETSAVDHDSICSKPNQIVVLDTTPSACIEVEDSNGKKLVLVPVSNNSTVFRPVHVPVSTSSAVPKPMFVPISCNGAESKSSFSDGYLTMSSNQQSEHSYIKPLKQERFSPGILDGGLQEVHETLDQNPSTIKVEPMVKTVKQGLNVQKKIKDLVGELYDGGYETMLVVVKVSESSIVHHGSIKGATFFNTRMDIPREFFRHCADIQAEVVLECREKDVPVVIQDTNEHDMTNNEFDINIPGEIDIPQGPSSPVVTDEMVAEHMEIIDEASATINEKRCVYSGKGKRESRSEGQFRLVKSGITLEGLNLIDYLQLDLDFKDGESGEAKVVQIITSNESVTEDNTPGDLVDKQTVARMFNEKEQVPDIIKDRASMVVTLYQNTDSLTVFSTVFCDITCKLCLMVQKCESKQKVHISHHKTPLDMSVQKCAHCELVLPYHYQKYHLCADMVVKQSDPFPGNVVTKKREIRDDVSYIETSGYWRARDETKICYLCGVKMKTLDGARRHFVHQHLYRYGCIECNTVLNGYQICLDHMEQHGKKLKVKCYMAQKGRRYRKRPLKKLFNCKICSIKYFEKFTLKKHIIDFHLKRKEFICEECGKVLSTDKLLRHHMRKHTLRHFCNVGDCRAGFLYKHLLNVHKEYKHKDEIDIPKPYLCNHCGHSFTRSYMLVEHERAYHSTVPQFVCKICGSAFQKRCTLYNHKLTHHRNPNSENVNSVRHVCELCGRIYKHKASLTYHKSREHQTSDTNILRKTTSKPASEYRTWALKQRVKRVPQNIEYKCEVCNTKYTSLPSLKHHIVTKGHYTNNKTQNYKLESFLCTDCGKIFGLSHLLKNHRRAVHLKIPKVKCEYCDREFIHRSSYNHHLYVHKGHPQCSLCDHKKFKSWAKVKRHMLEVHNVSDWYAPRTDHITQSHVQDNMETEEIEQTSSDNSNTKSSYSNKERENTETNLLESQDLVIPPPQSDVMLITSEAETASVYIDKYEDY